jgi:hypothetical protein
MGQETNMEIEDVRNTRSMRMDPESPAEYDEMDAITAGPNGMKLMPVFSGEMFQQSVAYPVIVEAWDKKNSGRHKRRWEATFTQAERNKISRYYGRFYRWYLVSGTPKRVSLQLNTLTLLQRAVNFFAEC